MKFTLLTKHLDGSYQAGVMCDQPRMNMTGFEKAYRGGPADYATQARVRFLPPGFTVWRAESGRLFAVSPD